MRTGSRTSYRASADDDYFERKSRELIVPEDEIEAWELDTEALTSLGAQSDYFNLPGSE